MAQTSEQCYILCGREGENGEKDIPKKWREYVEEMEGVGWREEEKCVWSYGGRGRMRREQGRSKKE